MISINYVEVTNGRNGYPSQVHAVTVGVDGRDEFQSFNEAQVYAMQTGGRVVLLHRQDGWQLWESKGPLYEEPKRTAEDEGDDYELMTEEDRDGIHARLKDLIDAIMDDSEEDDIDGTIHAIRNLCDRAEKLATSIDDMDPDQALLVHYPLSDDQSVDIIDLHPVHWHDTDNNEYMIGVEE